MRTYAIIYQDINRKGNTYLSVQYEDSLDEAFKKGFEEMDEELNYVLDGNKHLPSGLFKPISWRIEEIPEKEPKKETRKFNYINGLEYARDNYCRYKTEKELINRIIKRCQKKS